MKGCHKTIVALYSLPNQLVRRPVAQRWHAGLAVWGSIPAGGEYLFNRKRSPIAHSLSLSPFHRPDMTKNRLKT